MVLLLAAPPKLINQKKGDGLCWAGGDMLNCLKVPHICPHPDSGAGSPDTTYLGRSWRAAAAGSRGGRQRVLPGSCPLVLALFASKKEKKKPNHINTGREWWLLAAFLHPFPPSECLLIPVGSATLNNTNLSDDVL